MPKIITIRNKQSMSDIAIQEAGTVEAIIEIAVLNNISPTADLTPGQSLLVPDEFINKDSSVLEYYTRKKITPATSWTDPDQHGIGHGAIEIDFEIG